MAPFNPQVPDTPDPNYLGYSKAIEQPKPNMAMAELFKGVGDTLKAGVTAADTINKAVIDDQLRSAIDPEREGFTNALERIRGNVISGAKSLLAGAPDLPHEVQSFGDRLDNLQESYTSGKFTPLEYRKNLYTILKDVRANNPGYLDYIDQKASQITGFNIANAYMSSLLTDLNTMAAANKSGELKMDQFVKENMGILGVNFMQKWQTATGPERLQLFNQGELKVTERKTQEADVKAQENKLKGTKLTDEEKTIAANHRLDTRIPQLVNNLLEDTVQESGTSFPDLADQITAHLNGTKRMDASAIAKVAYQLQSIRPVIARKAYNEAVKTGEVGILGSEAVNKKIEDGLKLTLDPIVKAAGSENYAATNYYANMAKSITEQDSLSALLDKDMSPTLRVHKAFESVLANQSLYQKFIDREWQQDPQMPNKLRQFGINLKAGAAVPASTYEAQGETKPTINDSLDKLHSAGISKNGPNAKLMPKATEKVVSTYDMIKDPSLPDKGASAVVDWAFNPVTKGVLDKFDMEHINPKTGRIRSGALAVWDHITDTDVANRIYKTLPPEDARKYTDWVLDGFQDSIFRRTFNGLDEVNQSGKFKFSYDNTNKKIIVDAAPGYARSRFADNRPGTSYSDKDIGDVEWAKAQFAAENMNRGLAGLHRVETASGGKFQMDAAIVDTMRQRGIKLDEFSGKLITAISSANASQKPTEGRTSRKTGSMTDTISRFAPEAKADTVQDFVRNPTRGAQLPPPRPEPEVPGRKMAPYQNLTDPANTITGISVQDVPAGQ